jgi:serine/threonine protein kinase
MTMAPVALAFLILAGVIAIPFAIFAIVYLIVPACKGIGWLFMQLFNFITGEIGDVLRILGSIITTIVLIPLTVINVLIGRWSASAHYGRAIQNECLAMGRSIYRIAIGHPAKLLCLTPLTEGLEKRIPEVVAAAPGADRPGKRQGQFDGYAIVGSLPGGGSGGRLYIAEPSAEKIAAFAKQGQKSVGRVVIKSFSLADGSTLPQIVRENRALPAAKRMGLILEHDLTEERFYYVTRYVPGESLGITTQRLHASAGSGLDRQHLRSVCGYATDLLRTLTHYHEGGLWHKDVKPDNIIVADGQAHLVDFGLVTPLRSSMTLTTHGTEYFRDPEMVRMALRGVKVHEVDGAKFDIYAAGAVLYSMIENSFPAHGGLSQITKPCPEALRWIVRRAMTDYDKRYESAALMLEDIQTVCTADDPFAVKPFALPSMRGSDAAHHGAADQHGWEGMAGPVGAAAAAAAASVGAAPSPGAAPVFGRKPGPVASMLGQVGEYVDSALGQAGLGAAPAQAAGAGVAAKVAAKPEIKVTHWWSGKYEVVPGGPFVAVKAAAFSPAPPSIPSIPSVPSIPARPRNPASSAAEQLVRARGRAKVAQERAQQRMAGLRNKPNVGMNVGVGLAVLVFLGACGLFTLSMFRLSTRDSGLSANVAAMEAAPSALAGSNIPLAVSRTATDESAVFVPIADAIGYDVVVLRDPIGFQDSSRQAIDQALTRLSEMGMGVVGGLGAESDPQDDLTVAELRNAIGVAPFQTAESETAIRSWLDGHESAAAVVWIGRHEGGEPTAWLVTSSCVGAKDTDAMAGALTGKPAEKAKSNGSRSGRGERR